MAQHHSDRPFGGDEQFRKMVDDLKNTASFRGALGDFPEGKLTPTDEGSIQFAVGVKGGKVVLDFGTEVAWLGMNPQQAADLAAALLKRAREAARATGEPVEFTIA